METVPGLQGVVNSQARNLYNDIEPELNRLDEVEGIGDGEKILILIGILAVWKVWNDHFNIVKKINQRHKSVFFASMLENGISRRDAQRIGKKIIEDLNLSGTAKLAELLRPDKAIQRLAEIAVKKYVKFGRLTRKEFTKSYWGVVGSTTPYASSYAYDKVFDGVVLSNRWVVARPVDKPCYGPAGEVRKVGKKFSNGLYSPPVHSNCLCVLTPVSIHKKNLFEKYL